MTPNEIEAFLKAPNIADLATVRPDGSPHVAPVWFDFDGDKVRIIAETKAVKVRNIRHEPRVSVSIATNHQPYAYVLVNGTAEVAMEPAETPELVRALAVRYQGEVEGARYAERIMKEMTFCVITITPSSMTGWTSPD